MTCSYRRWLQALKALMLSSLSAQNVALDTLELTTCSIGTQCLICGVEAKSLLPSVMQLDMSTGVAKVRIP